MPRRNPAVDLCTANIAQDTGTVNTHSMVVQIKMVEQSGNSDTSTTTGMVPQSDTAVNTHSMVSMKKSALPKARQTKNLPTRTPPRRFGGKDSVKENRQGCLSRLIRAETGGLYKGMCSPVSTKKKTPVGVFFIWWTRRDSNPRPPRCERGALPTEPRAHLCADLKFRSPIIARLPGGVKQKPPPELLRRELFLRGNINW